MNHTLTSLTLSGVRSRFMVNPIFSRRTQTSIHSFKISQSFSTFISHKTPIGNLQVLRSSFDRFLSHAISVDSYAEVAGAMVTDHQLLSGQGEEVLIIDSSFSHCSSQVDHGGAILFDLKTLSVRMDRVFFLKCTTPKSGGGFHAILDNMTISRTCFDECLALESGNAFYVDLHSRQFVANITEVTIMHSALRENMTGKGAAIFMTGIFRVQLTNCSENYAMSLCSAFASLGSTELSFTFSEFKNCSSLNLLKVLDLGESLLSAFSNFICNTATVSLVQSSGKNNFVNSVFIWNEVPKLFSGDISQLSINDCIMDEEYSFDGIPELKTPGLVVSKDADSIFIHFAFYGQCRIVGEREGLNQKEIVNQIVQQVPDANKQNAKEFGNLVLFEPPVPTARNPYVVEEPEEPLIDGPMPRTRRVRNVPTRTKGLHIRQPGDEDPNIPSRRSRSSDHSHAPAHITYASGRHYRDTKSKPVAPKVFTPSASFSPSETFYKSRTFLPSLQFTASVSPAQSLVPYVLYSAAGFVVFAVLISFLFLKSSEIGYNLMTPSESADSRLDDYQSSTSTTVTITAESSSVVV